MNVTVYLSSRNNISLAFKKATAEVADGIGRMGAALVYGGSNAGQMHTLAATAKAAGAKIIGVIPEIFRHLADPLADRIIYTKDLGERKTALREMGDAYVALPGGIGTLDEVMSTLAEMTVSRNFDKKILLVNIDGVFDPLIAQLQKFAELGLASKEAVDSIVAVSSAGECIEKLKQLTK